MAVAGDAERDHRVRERERAIAEARGHEERGRRWADRGACHIGRGPRPRGSHPPSACKAQVALAWGLRRVPFESARERTSPCPRRHGGDVLVQARTTCPSANSARAQWPTSCEPGTRHASGRCDRRSAPRRRSLFARTRATHDAGEALPHRRAVLSSRRALKSRRTRSKSDRQTDNIGGASRQDRDLNILVINKSLGCLCVKKRAKRTRRRARTDRSV